MSFPNLPEGCEYFPQSALKPELRAEDDGLALVVGTKVVVETNPSLSIVGGGLSPVNLHSPTRKVAYALRKSGEIKEAFDALEAHGVKTFHRVYDGLNDTGQGFGLNTEADLDNVLAQLDAHLVNPEYVGR